MRYTLPALLFPVAVFGAPNVSVGPNVHVSSSQPLLAHGEVTLAADPNDAAQLLGASMFTLAGGNTMADLNTHCVAYVSHDGGLTWTKGAVTPELRANDPTVTFGPDGIWYFLAKTPIRHPRKNSDWDALYLRRSTDGGKTWEFLPGTIANDRPFVTVDCTEGKFRGRLYAAFDFHVHGEEGQHSPDGYRNTVRLATSLDGGKSYRYLYDRVMMDQGGAETAGPCVGGIVVLSDGTVVISAEHEVTVARAGSKGKMVRSWMQAFISVDGGESLEPAIKVADIGASTYNLRNSITVQGSVAVDPSGGPTKDRIYIAWADAASGRSEIFVSASADKARTWSKPRRVNDDSPAKPPAGGPDDFMANVAVNRDGVVGVTWYDRRDNPDNLGYYMRFSASLDGGETWLPSVRVSEAANAIKSNLPFDLTGGHTAGLAADAHGVFHALWIDNRTGLEQVWTAPITVAR